jgi:toxin-antitoxin system PIN domain toxin
MSSFFPDLNVWMALSVAGHSHSAEAWRWLTLLPADARLVFSRYTHVGLLRLLTNDAVMGRRTLTLGQAWNVYDRWRNDPRVEFHAESRGLEGAFREVTAPFAAMKASHWVGDCYLLAFAKESEASLVTFDKKLLNFARKHGHSAILPA